MTSGDLITVGGSIGGINSYNYIPKLITGSFTTSGTLNVLTNLFNLSGKGILTKALIKASYSTSRRMTITIDGTIVLDVAGAINGSSYHGSIGLIQTSDVMLVENGSGYWSIGTELGKSYIGFTNVAQFPSTSPQTYYSSKGIGVALSGGVKFNTSLLIQVSSNTASDVFDYNIGYLS